MIGAIVADVLRLVGGAVVGDGAADIAQILPGAAGAKTGTPIMPVRPIV